MLGVDATARVDSVRTKDNPEATEIDVITVGTKLFVSPPSVTEGD